MADLERLKRALQAAHAAGDTAAATKLAQAIRAAQATPATPSGDTSMGTAFAVADKQAEAAGNLGSAAITRRVNQGPLGQAQEFMFDKVGNPIREFFGMDPVDIAAVNQASSEEATAKAAQAQQSANQFAEDSNFENLTLDSVNDLGSFFKYVGQKGAQAAPYMAVSMASGGTATYPFSVGEISGALEEIEGKTQEEKDQIATLGGGIMTMLENLGIASLLPAGVSNNIIGGIASGAITEGFTEGVQELVVIGSEAYAGKKFTEEELVSRLKEATAAGAAVGGSFKAGGQTINATSKIFSSDGSVNNPDNMSPEGAAAAGAFARRLREIAQANEYDLKDVNANSTNGARETVDKAHIQLAEELKKVFKDLGELVTPDKLKSFVETKDQILAQAAYREARNKTKSTVGQQELDAMRRLVGDTAEGQQAINLMLQLNQLTEVHNAGYKGGLSRITDVFNPLDQNINSYDTASRVVTGTLSPLATAAGAVSTGGASLAPQAALFGTGRAVDAMTGRRSTVDRFVRRNEGNSPDLPAPTAPSLVETKRLQEQQARDETQRNQEQQKQLNLQLAQQDAPATPGSPQFTMEDATGLSRDGVARILRVLKGRNDNPALIRAIQEYEQSVASGGRIEDLSPLIRAVRQFQEQNPDYVPMVRPPNSLSNPMLANPAAPGQPPAVSTTEANPVQAQTFGPQFTTQQNYNRGIEANKAMNAELVEGVTTDPELNRVQKGRLITSLDVLANNLGSDPVAAAQEQVQKLEEAGVPQEAIDAYVKPYVDRVVGQQARKDVNQPRMQLANPLFAMPLQIEGKPTVKKIGEAMNQDHLDKVGRQLFPEQSEEDYGMVRDYADQELEEQLKQPNSGVGWYSKDVDESMRLASKVFPTLATDPEHRQLYLTFAGIFSNGSDPDNAFIMSSWAFDDFLRTGQIPVNRAEGFYQQGLEPPKTTFKSTKTGKMVTKDAGWGIRNQANEQQLGMLKYLVETRGGLKPAMEFLLTPQKRADINDVMLNSGLYKDGRFKTKKEKEGPDEYGFLAFGKKLGRYSLGLHGVDIDAGDTTIDLWYTRTFRRWTGRLLETPIGKEGVAAQPANDAERDAIFKLTGELASKYNLPVGDVQALLWFFEKRTWGAQGLNTKEGTNSSGARKLLRERGIDPDQDDDGAGSNGAGTQNSATPQQPRANIGVAGALANAIQGSNPRPSSGNTVPSDAEVKQQYEPTRAAFQVGKKGTDTENGIKDVDGVNRLAEAMGVHLKAYGAQRRMSKEMNPGGQMSVGLTGLYLPSINTAAYLKPGVKRGDGSFVGENESFITALHELAHGIADKNADGSVSPHSTRMTNNLTDSTNVVRVGSFEYVIGEILERPANERNEIRDEIIKLQDKMRYTFADGTSQATRDLVEVKQMYEQMASTRDEAFRRQWAPIIRNHTKYVRNVYEMAVDPLIWYLFDPKAFKKEAPKTAKLIRDYFNEAGKIQFYSHPLAMGVAVVLAMLMKADQEDEQKKQMPPGALNQPMPMGALSA